MITQLYAIYDDKAKIFNKPFYQINEAVAERTARMLLSDNKDIAFSPSDFTMYRMGTFDDTTGILDIKEPELFITFNQLGDNQQ
jgi:hypothetical protein